MTILAAFGTPQVFLDALEMFPEVDYTIHCAEFFAGVASIVWGFSQFNLHAEPIDARRNINHDLNKFVDLVFALWILLHMPPGALAWMAPPCPFIRKFSMNWVELKLH